MNEGIIIFKNPEEFIKLMEELHEAYNTEEGVDYNI